MPICNNFILHTSSHHNMQILQSEQSSPCILANNTVSCKPMRSLECDYCRACSSAKNSIYFATIESKTVQSLLNQSRDISPCSFSTGRATCESVLSRNAINFLIRKPLSIALCLQSAYPVISSVWAGVKLTGVFDAATPAISANGKFVPGQLVEHTSL